GWQEERGDTYGANETPVGGGMPGFGEDQLSDHDLLFVVLHERMLGGENPDTEDAEALEAVALLMSENPDMTLEEAMAEVGVEAPAANGGTQSAESGADNAPEEGSGEGSEGNQEPSDGG